MIYRFMGIEVCLGHTGYSRDALSLQFSCAFRLFVHSLVIALLRSFLTRKFFLIFNTDLLGYTRS